MRRSRALWWGAAVIALVVVGLCVWPPVGAIACDSPALGLGVDDGLPSGVDLEHLPLTVVVADDGSARRVTELYRLPDGAGYVVRQDGLTGTRPDATWGLWVDDTTVEVPDGELPRVG